MPESLAEHAARVTLGEMASRAHLDTLNAGRETVRESATSWRRVSDGKPCGFCAMLVTRGPVYTSSRAAGRLNSYHAHCGCTVEPYEGRISDWEPTPEEERYLEAYDAVYHPGMSGEETAARMEQWFTEHAATTPTAPARFGSVLEDVINAKLVKGPITREQWNNLSTTGRANSDYRYIAAGDDRAQGVLMYSADQGDRVKAIAANMRAGRGPLDGIDLDTPDPWSGKAPWEQWVTDGYSRADMEADLKAAASWLLDREPTRVGDVFRGMNFDPDMSWAEVLKAIKTRGWNYTSASKDPLTAQLYSGRPDRSRSVVMQITGADGIDLPGVGNFSHTQEVLVSGEVRITKVTYRDTDGWGERMYVEAEWVPTS